MAFVRWLPALLLVLACAAAEDTSSPYEITFEPEDLNQKYEDLVFVVNFASLYKDASKVVVTSSDESVATAAVSPDVVLLRDGDNVTGSFNVTTVILGYATVNVSLFDDADELLVSAPFEVSVLLKSSDLAEIFSNSLIIIVGAMYIVVGSTIDLSIVKRIVKKPIGPLLGLFCQYCCMPLISFGMAMLIFEDPYLRLGMFMSGCSPGGGPSNYWTHLFGGNLDLSITMTFTSTFFALGAIPAWVLLLGPVISKDSAFIIPFDQIAISLVLLIVPCSLGIFFQLYVKRVAKVLAKFLTPLALFNVCYISTFGLYANRYVFDVVDVKIVLSSLALPFLGYTAGLTLATLLRQERRDAIAISIETGIQSATVAMVLLTISLPSPADLIAIVIPGHIAVITPIPLLCILLIKTAIEKCRNRNSKKTVEEKTASPAAIEGASEKVPEKPSEKAPKLSDLSGFDNPAADIEAI